jgi:hypothetical protein
MSALNIAPFADPKKRPIARLVMTVEALDLPLEALLAGLKREMDLFTRDVITAWIDHDPARAGVAAAADASKVTHQGRES